ncbi:hypothetical protein BDDG_13336 [Blastomyces dermatitidis ATCC 18188]|uniref:Uncharacterized protein n=1 Tax=Ajellomyces dermatitidis (strain ATCC 18188 / CBS 674.68) TaxID=653446 RepID=A0A0J9ESX1_AJEDA|nr:hypothetical protein BDDG_13336 [Blastomyces dermatitidis ATCC 18188]
MRFCGGLRPINYIDYFITLHRFFHSRSPIRGRYERVRSDPQPFPIADPRPLRTRVAYTPILSHSQLPILGRYERAYILPPRSSTTYIITYAYKYPS